MAACVWLPVACNVSSVRVPFVSFAGWHTLTDGAMRPRGWPGVQVIMAMAGWVTGPSLIDGPPRPFRAATPSQRSRPAVLTPAVLRLSTLV